MLELLRCTLSIRYAAAKRNCASPKLWLTRFLESRTPTLPERNPTRQQGARTAVGGQDLYAASSGGCLELQCGSGDSAA
jgi:hypothetical protein